MDTLWVLAREDSARRVGVSGGSSARTANY